MQLPSMARTFQRTSGAIRTAYLTAATLVTRKQHKTVVYRSSWLAGQYAVHMEHGYTQAELEQVITDQIIELLPGEPTAGAIRIIRQKPYITIMETF